MRVMKRITLVLGTARKGRNSERVARYVRSLFEAQSDARLTFVDVREHIQMAETVPPWGEGGANEVKTPWQKIATDTESFVFILREYNHGYPGEWKLLLDSLYKEYKGKDAYIVGVSDGTFSGVRVADHVKPVLVEVGLVPQRTALYVGHADDALTEEGESTDEKFSERAEAFVAEVCRKA